MATTIRPELTVEEAEALLALSTDERAAYYRTPWLRERQEAANRAADKIRAEILKAKSQKPLGK